MKEFLNQKALEEYKTKHPDDPGINEYQKQLDAKLSNLRKRNIERKIRERYSVSDELAILRQKDTNPEEYEAYNKYVEKVKKSC